MVIYSKVNFLEVELGSPWRMFLELFGNRPPGGRFWNFSEIKSGSPCQTFLKLSGHRPPGGHFWNFPEIKRGSPWGTFLELSGNQAWLPWRTFLKLCGNRTLTDIFGTFQKSSVAPPGGRFWNFFGKPNRHDLRSQICCRIGQCSRNFIAYFETTYLGRKKRKHRSDPRCRC